MRASAIYTGSITHLRLRPKRHRLRYRGFYLLVDLDELASLKSRLFAVNRFNLFSFHERDHGDGSAVPLKQRVERQLQEAGIATGGAIRLLTMPRVLGVVFNPLSVYFCHGADGALSAVLYEVNNTFGQRHSYLLPVAPGTGPEVRQCCAKRFHVSPFMDMALDYQFRLTPPGERVAIGVSALDQEGPVLVAAFAGARLDLTDAALARAFPRHPLLALQVLGGIHWEALKLWRKGFRLRPRPAPPAHPISILTATEAS